MIYPFEAPRTQQSKLLPAKNKNKKKKGTVTYNTPTPSLHRPIYPKPPNLLPPPPL